MSTKKDACKLSGHQAEFESNISTGITHVDSEAVGGVYGYLYDQINFGEKINQFNLNCARRTLQIIRENKNKTVVPVWTKRANVENLTKFFQESREEYGKLQRIVCAIEDAKEEYVDHSEKPIVLLESFAKRLGDSGAYSSFQINFQDQVWARIIDASELFQVLSYLKDSGYIKMILPNNLNETSEIEKQIFSIPIQMTVSGWEKIRKLHQRVTTNKVFIATQFSWPIDDNLRVEAIEKIRLACKDLGYEADVVSQNHTGNITDKIVSEIKSARFVIAELTYNNRGVYYEAGLARGLDIPVFHVLKKGFANGNESESKKVHFDIQQIMYREWKDPEDLHLKLKDWISATVGKYNT